MPTKSIGEWFRPRQLAAAVLGIALVVSTPVAAEDEQPSGVLRIAVSDHGRSVFNALIETIRGLAATGPALDVSYASPVSVLRSFCVNERGLGPDVALTTQRMSPSMASECAANGVHDIAEVQLGRAALTLAVKAGSPVTNLTTEQIYLGLARDVPDNGEFRRNTFVRWSDIDKSLPQLDIRFQIPPKEYGGRSLFDSLILEGGCRKNKFVRGIFEAAARTARCTTVRFDRVREIPRDQAVKMLMDAPAGTIGVINLADIAASNGALIPVSLDGVAPTDRAIIDGAYAYSTSLWMFAKLGPTTPRRARVLDDAVERIVRFAIEENVVGEDGVVARSGALPLPLADREEQRHSFDVAMQPWGVHMAVDWTVSALSGTWNFMTNLIGELRAPDTQQDIDFTGLMQIAGYKLKEFESAISLIPSASMTFGIAREMSESDLEYLEHMLYRDARKRPGAVATMQRRVIRAIIDASSSDEYQVSKVEVTLLPLPKVQLIISPSGGDSGSEADLMSRVLDKFSERLPELAR